MKRFEGWHAARCTGRTVWHLPLWGLPLTKWFLLPGITLADAALAVLVTASLPDISFRKRLKDLPLPCRLFVPFWIWSVIAGLAVAISSPLPFSVEEFLRSIAKLTFYLIAGSLLASRIAEASGDGAESIVYQVLLVHSVIATALYVVTWIAPGWIHSLPLPGYDSPTSGFYFHLRWFGDSSPQSLEHLAFPRAQGLLCEPSWMATAHALGLGHVLLSPRCLPRIGYGHLLIVLSVVLSFSLTGYVLLLVVVLLTVLRWRREAGHHFASRRLLWMAVLLSALLTLTPAVRSTMQYAIGCRMGRMLQGSVDGATKARLAENWIAATSIAEKSWMLGSGLGNFDVALEEIRRELPHPELIPVGSQGWNIPAYVLATTGVVGLALLLLPHLALARGHPYLGVLQAVSLFAHSGLLEPSFWLIFVLFTAAGMAREPPSQAADMERPLSNLDVGRGCKGWVGM